MNNKSNLYFIYYYYEYYFEEKYAKLMKNFNNIVVYKIKILN